MTSHVVTAVVVALISSVVIVPVWSHGRLLQPPSRASMWRLGFDTPKNYMDNQLFCGGFTNQWEIHDGKCGVCGDPWQGPRDHEAGGRYATGLIPTHYASGAIFETVVEITASHWGWFEFRLCPNNDPNRAVTQDCLDKYLLKRAGGRGTRYPVLDSRPHRHRVLLVLPPGVHCTQCVLQWKYHAGNSWGTTKDGQGCVGCGPQEEFYGCADIAVGDPSLATAVAAPGELVPSQPSDPSGEEQQELKEDPGFYYYYYEDRHEGPDETLVTGQSIPEVTHFTPGDNVTGSTAQHENTTLLMGNDTEFNTSASYNNSTHQSKPLQSKKEETRLDLNGAAKESGDEDGDEKYLGDYEHYYYQPYEDPAYIGIFDKEPDLGRIYPHFRHPRGRRKDFDAEAHLGLVNLYKRLFFKLATIPSLLRTSTKRSSKYKPVYTHSKHGRLDDGNGVRRGENFPVWSRTIDSTTTTTTTTTTRQTTTTTASTTVAPTTATSTGPPKVWQVVNVPDYLMTFQNEVTEKAASTHSPSVLLQSLLFGRKK